MQNGLNFFKVNLKLFFISLYSFAEATRYSVCGWPVQRRDRTWRDDRSGNLCQTQRHLPVNHSVCSHVSSTCSCQSPSQVLRQPPDRNWRLSFSSGIFECQWLWLHDSDWPVSGALSGLRTSIQPARVCQTSDCVQPGTQIATTSLQTQSKLNCKWSQHRNSEEQCLKGFWAHFDKYFEWLVL